MLSAYYVHFAYCHYSDFAIQEDGYSDDVTWQGHTLEWIDLKWSHEMVYGILLLMGPI